MEKKVGIKLKVEKELHVAGAFFTIQLNENEKMSQIGSCHQVGTFFLNSK